MPDVTKSQEAQTSRLRDALQSLPENVRGEVESFNPTTAEEALYALLIVLSQHRKVDQESMFDAVGVLLENIETRMKFRDHATAVAEVVNSNLRDLERIRQIQGSVRLIQAPSPKRISVREGMAALSVKIAPRLNHTAPEEFLRESRAD